MKWFAALLAALAVLQAGGVCASPAHAAGPEAMADHHAMAQDNETACHDAVSEPQNAATHPAMDAPADRSLDCCESGACADCALVIGALVSNEADAAGVMPMIKAARAPQSPRGRPLSHDPPPPRA